MAGKVRVHYIDRKSEKGSFQLPTGVTAPTEESIKTITALTYLGVDSFSTTTTSKFGTPQDVVVNAFVNNDRDFKAILGFEGAEGYFKMSLPALKINIEGGVCIRWGSDKAFIPPTKAVGEVGNDGNQIATLLRSYTGDNTIVFKSGHLFKS